MIQELPIDCMASSELKMQGRCHFLIVKNKLHLFDFSPKRLFEIVEKKENCQFEILNKHGKFINIRSYKTGWSEIR